MFRLPCAEAVRREEVFWPPFLFDLGGVLRAARTSAQPIPKRLRTIDLRSLTILRRPSDPIALLHLQKSEGDSEGPQWHIERSFEQPRPSPLHVFLFGQRAEGPVPARMGHEEGGGWAWGRNSFPQDQEKCSPQRPLCGSRDGEIWKEFARRSVRRPAEFGGLGGISWGKVCVIVICEPGPT